MTVSLVSALLQAFDLAPASSTPSGELTHRLAQASHALAQKSIGSGYDIATAVYSSCVYTRFPPSTLGFLREREILLSELRRCLAADTGWTHTVTPCALPDWVHLACGEVGRGSNTPSLVSGIQRWRNQQPAQARELWTKLAATNEAIIASLLQLARQTPSAPILARLRTISVAQLQLLSPRDSNLEPTLLEVQRMVSAFAEARSLLRRMGELAGVPVEPPSQTALIDATLAIPGVLAAGVPGAGGYDAVFVLVCSENTLRAVETLWKSLPEPVNMLPTNAVGKEPQSSSAL
eukprot:TRINITY_DN9002_c0_g1_i1.p1 TRINITY_DN9002_c0_g1~~TRINITY_DN9002_c0_g1_i1.p1  ORF type:complete len:292 (+),score=35.08 TRINITY_DN9002_c0_g1_i1:483-1358(+)